MDKGYNPKSLQYLIEFKANNFQILSEWKELIIKTRLALFKENCKKKDLTDCETINCVFSMMVQVDIPDYFPNLKI